MLDLTNHKAIQAQIADKFDGLVDPERNDVMTLVALYHYRDGKKHDDGSMGTVAISPKQLRDLLAWVMTKYSPDEQASATTDGAQDE